MLSRKPPLSHMQKTYDDCYLVCSTAVYFETQNNEAEALRSWKNALEQINYHNAFRVPTGYRARSETERALMESLREMEGQCRERVELLEALKRSREESEDAPGGGGKKEGKKESSGEGTPKKESAPGGGNEVDGWMGGGTVPPSSFSDLGRPPPLPRRPLPPRMESSASETDVQLRARSLPQMEEPVLPSLTPFASNPKQPAKPSRTPSPEKRSMLRTLRPGGGDKRKDSSTIKKTKAPVPAAKAATFAWTPGAARPGSSASAVNATASKSPTSNNNSTASLTRASAVTAANTSLPREKARKSEPPTVLAYRKEYTPPKNQIDTSAAIAAARRYHGRMSSYDTSPTREEPSSSDAPRRSFEISGSSADERVKAARRKPPVRKPIAKKEKEPVLLSEDSDASPTDTRDDLLSEATEQVSPEDQRWKERVAQLMKNLPKGVDENAAKQIFNEVVVHGDEVRWDDVAGLDVAKNALKETVVYPFLRPDLFMGLREPARGMLLFGPPGTGKTMLARAVATESKSTFFAISASSLTSKFLGESEKLVRALFQLAKSLAPSIIFVDEIDSLLSARGDSGEHEATRRIKTEFLIQWSDLARAAAGREQSDKEKEKGDASRVLVLAATNMPWAIDEAARRRFVRRQYIPLPEDHVRKLQLETLLSHQKHSLSARDIDRLVRLTDNFSGSDITALAKDAAMGPLRSLGEALLSMTMDQIRPIGLQDFENSLRSIRPSVSKQGLRQFEEWAREYGERGG